MVCFVLSFPLSCLALALSCLVHCKALSWLVLSRPGLSCLVNMIRWLLWMLGKDYILVLSCCLVLSCHNVEWMGNYYSSEHSRQTHSNRHTVPHPPLSFSCFVLSCLVLSAICFDLSSSLFSVLTYLRLPSPLALVFSRLSLVLLWFLQLCVCLSWMFRAIIISHLGIRHCDKTTQDNTTRQECSLFLTFIIISESCWQDKTSQERALQCTRQDKASARQGKAKDRTKQTIPRRRRSFMAMQRRRPGEIYKKGYKLGGFVG